MESQTFYLPHIFNEHKSRRRKPRVKKGELWTTWSQHFCYRPLCIHIQGESLARDPKLLSIKNYVIEIMTWKFRYTHRERCKTGPAHIRCWNWSPFTSKYTWMRFSKFWNTFPKVSTLTAWISWRLASLSCSIVRGCIFVHFALQ